MTSRTWIFRTAVVIAAIFCINAVIAMCMDPYGIFRDSHGRQLRIVFTARKGKFLLSKHYVPANFDALLIGPSNSENWNLAALPGYKIFNESILGSNVFEEKRIVDQALPAGHFRLVVCVLYPTMTATHTMQDGLDAVSTAESIGSIHLYVHEAVEVLTAMHLPAGRVSAPNGSTPLREFFPQSILGQRFPPEYFYLDPVAVASYSQMLHSLQAQGARIVYVIPPLYQPCLAMNTAALEDHKLAMQRLLPSAPIIDMDSPALADFRSDLGNYMDCFHVNAKGAAKIDDYLVQAIPEALKAD